MAAALAAAAAAAAAAPRAPAWPELEAYNPVAPASQQVVSGDARFTVLTPRLIRMEQRTACGAFEDRATTAFLHRDVPPAHFTAAHDGGVLTIATAAVTVRYTVGQPFAAESLSATGTDGSSAFRSWHYGQTDAGNLLGTIKSLDQLAVTSLNCTENAHIRVHDEDLHCAWGLVSRSGWAAVDDSDTWALDTASGWWVEPNVNDIDVYLFAHGHDYKGALADFVAVSGRPALPPRAAVGVWWTRWYNLNSADVRKVVDDYRTRSLPLDVFVLDMDWHKKNAWGGYSWDRRIIPNPKDLMADYLKAREGLVTLVNVHDNDGVGTYDDEHAAMAAAMGLPNGTGKIDFAICSNQSYALALEDVVIKALEDVGVDYLWIDWQQGGAKGGCHGMKQNPTIWTNKIRVTDQYRRGSDKRGMVLARWGGIGTHRYPVGFSGDVKGLTWPNLAYQPYFSSTAANVGYGFWSHDITGAAQDYELYARWLQWAAYSGVMRSHDRGESAGSCDETFPRVDGLTDSCSIVKPWNVPTSFMEVNRAALRTRAALVPYTYTLAREAFDTGVGPLRPLYYEFPELDYAYRSAADGSFAQYFFGADLCVAPVVTPSANHTMTNTSDLAAKQVWVPPGDWVEQDTGAVRAGAAAGDTVYSGLFPVSEVPVLVRPGAVIATRPIPRGVAPIGLAARPYDALVFSIYPGAAQGNATVYEDDGATTAYLKGQSAATTAAYTYAAGTLTASVATAGSYPGLPAARSVTLRLVNAPPPASVTVAGAALTYARYGGAGTWSYDGAAATAVVELPPRAPGAAVSIAVHFAPAAAAAWEGGALGGVRGAVAHANLAKQALDATRQTPGSHEPDTQSGRLDELSVAGEVLSYTAGGALDTWLAAARGVRAQVAAALAEVAAIKKVDARRKAYAAALLQTSLDAMPSA